MSILVAGILKSPTGEVIAGAQITLTALTTSFDLLSGASASAVTTDAGYYGMNVLPGVYSLTVAVNGKNQVYGSFRLDGTETTVTLNMVLRRSIVEVSIPDALLVDFRQIQNNVADDLETMRRLVSSATTSESNAHDSAEAAANSAAAAAVSEKNAEVSAQKLAQAAESATAQASTATAASQSAQNSAATAAASEKTAQENALTASQAASEAKAARDDVTIQVTGFDTHVSQKTAEMIQAAKDAGTQVAQDAAAEASKVVTDTGNTVRQEVITQGQMFVDDARTESE
ncbi:carboxypeptidase regulatory-like domain-containing protein, partial [Salmonella enterica]|nr:carboxypeptidase regulatory-like domain-containing protein [Salmonella enterica]EAX3609475.1 carboxypeptidase regulatory-like domain-containing protein [Salmonella enterica]EGW6283030.1 carboxypeptidase regulatory-like domain-containing protein [Salmonella enterica]EGX3935434.1 carboxypeptidase regulatory-like domain-containing protein [Salmonella enterica]